MAVASKNKPSSRKRAKKNPVSSRNLNRYVPNKSKANPTGSGATNPNSTKSANPTGSGATNPNSAKSKNPPVLIWRGFRHQWGYNHRLNRLGDFIKTRNRTEDTVEADLVHSAASGTGKDTAEFTSYYTELQTNHAWFKSGHCKIRIESHEEVSGLIQRKLSIKLPEELKGKESYTVLLNGFDLIAESDDGFKLIADRDADKLLQLHLGVTSPIYISKSDKLEFEINGLLNVDCDSYECDGYPSWELGVAALGPAGGPLSLVALGMGLAKLAGKFNITTDYTLHVHYLIVGGDSGFKATESRAIENRYNFDKKKELKRGKDGQCSATLKGEQGKFTTGAVGIKSLQLSLERAKGFLKADDAMHMLQLDMNVRPKSSARYQMTVDLDLFFRNWCEGMKNAHLPGSAFAHKDAGAVIAGIVPVFLQFASAEIEHKDRSSKIIWDKSNADADSAQAESTLLLPPERNLQKYF